MIRRENTIMAVEKAKFNNLCENFMDKVMDIYDVPGVQVGVSVGDVSYTAARGYRNFFTKDPLKILTCSTAHRFRRCSRRWAS